MMHAEPPSRSLHRAFGVTLLLFFAAALSLAAPARAAERTYFFETIGSEQGLAQNTVTATFQDSSGYVWIGTQGGLHLYDGYRFTLFAHSADDAATLPASLITALAEDASGRIWVGTAANGLARLERDTGLVQRFPLPEAAAADRNERETITALAFDAKRGLWAGTVGAIELVDPESGARQLRLRLPEGPAIARIAALKLVSDGTLWIASETGLFRLPVGATTLERIDAAQLKDVHGLLETHDGALHVGTDEGLFRIDPTEQRAHRVWPASGNTIVTAIAEDNRGRFWMAVPHEGLALFEPAVNGTQWLRPDRQIAGSLPEALVTTLLVDRSGLLWLGTSARGVAKADPNGAIFRYIVDQTPARNFVATNNIRALMPDRNGGLWLGTEGDGLKRLDLASGRYDYYADAITRALGLRDGADLHVSALATNTPNGDDGKLWVASNHGVVLLDTAQRRGIPLRVDPKRADALPEEDVRALLRASDGTIWVGTRRFGVVHIDPAQAQWDFYRHKDGEVASLSNNFVFSLHEDREHRIWAGTFDGLNLIDPKNKTVRVLRHDTEDSRSLAGSIVRVIHESTDGTLWFGTHDGLNRLDELTPERARFTRWTPREGLPNGTIYGILEDTMGRLWLSSNRGVAYFDRANAAFHAFSLKDGLQGLEFNGGAFAALANNSTFAFGGLNGLNVFTPEAIAGSRYVAPVVITDVRVGNGELHQPRADKLTMEQSDRVVRFEFAALDYTSPETNRFSYKLDGFDEHFIEAGTRHDATYTNLDAGHYVFHVHAANHDGHWNEKGTSLDLTVIAPWWASRPFKALYAALIALALFLLWRGQRRKRDEERRHHVELREREDRLRLALWGSGDEFWDWDMRRGVIVRIGADQLLGGEPEEELGAQEWKDRAVHPEDLPLVEKRLDDHVSGRVDCFESEHRIRTSRGDWIWVLSRGKIVERDTANTPLRVVGTARNITATRLAERERRIAQEVIRSMTEAVTVTDLEFRFISVNPAFTRITGWREDEVIGRPASILNCAQHPPEHYQAMRDTMVRTGHWRGELWQRRKDSEEFLCWLELSDVRDASGQRTHYVGVLTDITDRKRAEQELRYLANYDTLTGLPNRTLLAERLGHAIIRARRGGKKVAVLFLDLDRFKHVNDSMGHAAGDRMLKAAGSRLRHVVREGDTVARLGGDEFTVVLEDITSVLEAERVSQKLLAAFAQPLELDNGQEVVISPSIGVSMYPEHGQVPTDLLKFADTAMYQAKERGRNTYMIYTEAMDAAARLRATMVSALRKALERNEFSLVYQPKLSLLDERITGVEALLRWNSEELGLVGPATFIPVAEETGLIIEIGDWVLNQACAQIARWRDAGVRDLTVSVNLSVLQLLRGELPQRLCDILAEHDVAPNQLELELTESMVMANAEQSITTLRQLKAVGVTLAIDDFGTGYSSLAYLKRLPIDTLKIDKEFVGDITTDPDDEAITATVITMAHSLGLNVVAEGVEMSEQVEYLREQGCDEIQGHWLSVPLPADQCLALLRERALRRKIALGELR